jgi:hypothetical protein
VRLWLSPQGSLRGPRGVRGPGLHLAWVGQGDFQEVNIWVQSSEGRPELDKPTIQGWGVHTWRGSPEGRAIRAPGVPEPRGQVLCT